MDNMIGIRIKDRRKALKLTGAQIKEKTGISTGNLSDIENGRSLPSATAIVQLAQILECSTDYILLGKTLNSENLEFPRTRYTAYKSIQRFARRRSRRNFDDGTT